MKDIAPIIKEEHAKLSKQWAKFIEEYQKDVVKSGLVLEQFKWNLQKHFQMEELSIYELSESIKGNEVGTIFDLMADHGAILALLAEIEKKLNEEVKGKIQEFREALDKHEQFEDNNFYPLLDSYLNENQKASIIIKIKSKIIEKDNSKPNNIGL